jgi:ferritin
MKENTKNQIQTLIDFINGKGNTMTIADIANVNESIDNIYLKLEDSEEDFPEKDEVIEYLRNLSDIMRKTPYFNLVQNTLFGLNGVMYLLK